MLLDTLDFAKKAIKHRKLQPIIALVGLVICVASTVFLVLLGQGLGLIFNSATTTRPVSFLSKTIAQFIYLDVGLIFLVGIGVVYFLFTSMMADRRRDVGLIKALGSMGETGFSYVMAEPLLIIIYGCVLGGLIGLSLFIGYALVFLPGTLLAQGWLMGVLFLGLLGVFFVGSWVIASRKAEEYFKGAPVSLFAGDVQNFDFVKEQLGGLKKFLDRLPWMLQVTLKSVIRSKSKTRTAMICLTGCIFLMTVSLAGGAVAWSTTRSYVDDSFGQNVIAIGKEPVLKEYENMMTNTLDTPLQAFNFLEEHFFIEEGFFEKLGTIQHVELIDTRLIMMGRVVEVQTTEIVNGNYVTYGPSNVRSTMALLVGLNAEAIADNLLTQPNPLAANTTIIGDALAQTLFDNALKQKIAIDSKDSTNRETFTISNINVDLINQGFVVYMPLDTLQKLYNLTGQNLILIKTQNTNAILEIETIAKQYNLNILPMDEVHQKSLSNIDTLWLSILPFPILSTITTLISLLNCLLVSFSGRIHDLSILRAIGAKNNYTAKMILTESITYTLPAALTGITLGMLFNLIFLIPNATITPQLLIICISGLTLLLLSMCLISTTIMLKLNKHST